MEMERLTKRNQDGSVGIAELRYYNHDDFQKIASKLADYEDAEEQGLLLRLPCKVGDTVYIGGMLGCSEIDEWEITNITMRWGENDEPYFYADLKRAKRNNCSFWMKEFGRSVFLTREEAEQALAEMQKGK